MQPNPLDFSSLEPVEEPFKPPKCWQGTNPMVLKEATAGDAAKYRDASLRCSKLEDGKIVGLDGLGELEALLVSLCLHECIDVQGTTGYKRVPIQVIRGWPSKVVTRTFNRAKEISELTERAAADADPKMVGLCRRDLAEQHHPDRGGNPDVMTGINIALDWLKRHVKEGENGKPEEPAKNGPGTAAATAD